MKIIEAAGAGVLAVGTGDQGAQGFLDSDMGKALVGICGAVAIVVVIVCIFRMIKSMSSGKPGEAFKTLAFGLVVGGMLFNLQMTVDTTHAMSGLVTKAFASFSKIANG